MHVVNEMNRLRFRDMDDEAIERNLSRAGQEPHVPELASELVNS